MKRKGLFVCAGWHCVCAIDGINITDRFPDIWVYFILWYTSILETLKRCSWCTTADCAPTALITHQVINQDEIGWIKHFICCSRLFLLITDNEADVQPVNH